MTTELESLPIYPPLILFLSQTQTTNSTDAILSYLNETGIPSLITTKSSLEIYLYFHQLLIPFYSFICEPTPSNQPQALLNILKDNYHLLADAQCYYHFNYDKISSKYFSNNSTSKEQIASTTPCNPSCADLTHSQASSPNHFVINYHIIELGLHSYGRLNVYVKAHIIKNLILFSGQEQLYAYNQIYQVMEDDLTKIYETAKKSKFTNEMYINNVNLFINGEKRDDWFKVISTYKKLLPVFQNVNDVTSIQYMEKLFIQLLGHFDNEVKKESVKILNMIYDETNWQEKNAFDLHNTNILLLNEQYVLTFLIKKNDYEHNSVVLIHNAPCINNDIHCNVFTWLKPTHVNEVNDKLISLTFELGNVMKCGYYDWYLAKFVNGRFASVKIVDNNNSTTTFDGKGRTIVLDKTIKDLSIHEVFCDLIKAEINKQQGRITKRGSFATLEEKIPELSQRYINCLYIMGALERDNEIAYDEGTGEAIDIANPNTSPMAVTSRSSISSLLGGDEAFKSLMKKAKTFSMKIIIDGLSRVSSSRCHRKYRDILLHYLDNNGNVQVCYGTDGHSVRYDDSAVLNYRKVEAWNMLIQEILVLADKYGIDGVHLDNCQVWPQMFEINAGEMFRIDNDGEPAYTAMDIINGEIVIPTEESGYWSSELCETYPNPLLIKMTKEIWKHHPQFVFFGECWLSEKFNKRHCSLTKSGIIPRMYTLPIIISEIFGRKIHRNGYIEQTKQGDVHILKDWYLDNYKNVPKGAMLIQSSSGQVWPYPALLYGRGNWSAVDILFTLPDIPMTFMDEIDGEAYRVKITNVYEAKDNNNNNKGLFSSSSSLTSLTATGKVSTRSKSLMKLIESKQQEMKDNALKSDNAVSQVTNNEYMPQYNLTSSISSLINLSGIDISQANELDHRRERLIREVGPEYGFDLTKIKLHYDHRRRMRNDHPCLRRGELIYLNTLDNDNKPHTGVFAFARVDSKETGIFAINFIGQETNFILDLTNILNKISPHSKPHDNTICFIEDWTQDDKGDYFFLRELIEVHANRKLAPYGSVCLGFSILDSSNDNVALTLQHSNRRMINYIKNGFDGGVDNYQITHSLKQILTNNVAIDAFVKWFNEIMELLNVNHVSFYEYVKHINFIKNNPENAFKLFTLCHNVKQLKTLTPNITSLCTEADDIITNNKLGPICFITPELGRWSTVGGLGVMVDELTQGLAAIGQDVICISPYYDKNRKGESGYLAKDEFKFEHVFNITVNLDGQYTFGVHYGTGNGGIKYYFLHNFKIFPKPYPDCSVSETVRQLALMAKGSLELLCHLKVIPAMIITNDWFTGLTPAYAKVGCFGDTFRTSTFFHICHNLQETYEGRLYPSNEEGTLDHIHQLPSNWLYDPYWRQKVFNPSRCAIMMSDQWGTVSNSYKQDLMNSSPLAPLLNAKPKPFGFPNGIFKVRRLKALQDKAGNDRLECKKYIQQKYFGLSDIDNSIPVYSFVGRITQQKGVLLILECVDELVRKTNGKINILVGGMGNPKDPYCAACINKINELKYKHPKCFWADPFEFFTDGPRVNMGSDFGLMPSLFEPGGIVQHEFFIAGTPVIAFRTGGLKDTVFEFQYIGDTGNGFTFDTYNHWNLIHAVERSLHLFSNKDKYEKCRKNAFNSAIDVADVSKAWCKEFYRLKNKIFIDMKKFIDVTKENVESAITQETIDEIKKIEVKEHKDIAMDKDAKSEDIDVNGVKKGDYCGEEKIPVTFVYESALQIQPNSVQLTGSFCAWQVRYPLMYDKTLNQWNVVVHMKRGTYSYKYIVDGQWVVNEKEKTLNENGTINNFLYVE